MSLWSPKKPLNQPPSFGRVGHNNTHAINPDPMARAAERAIHAAQFERDQAARRVGGRRAVVVE